MLALLVIIPLAAIIAILLKAPARYVTIGATAANLALAFWAAIHFNVADQAASLTPYFTAVKGSENLGPITFSLGLNGMSCIMMLLTALVSVAAALSGKVPEGKSGIWFSSILFLSAGAMGAFLSTDLFFFYAFHELALIPTFLMIGMFGRGDRKHIAWKATIYLATGSIVLLAGLVWLANIAGTFQIAELKAGVAKALADSPVEELSFLKCQLTAIAGLLLAGFGTLVSLFPFHSWAAPAYASAPAPIAMLHAGVLKKFGLYGLIMVGVTVMPSFFDYYLTVLLVLLLCNIIWVGLITINQKRIDLMLGNSSVMHMGYIFLAIAAFINKPDSILALSAAGLLMFAHGISIAMSFSLTDVIERKTSTLELNQLGGLAKTAPKIAFLFGLVGMASIGLPGLANFAGEVMVFFSGFEGWKATDGFGQVQWATMIAVWGVVISAVYFLRAFKNTFHGPLVESTKKVSDISLMEKLPAIILGATLLVVGVYPKIMLQFMEGFLK